MPDGDGVDRTWHYLEVGPADPVGTLLCVHGNPTWAYAWRHVLAAPPPGWRVVAVDQLDMGYSERTGTVRRLAQRVSDLVAFADEVVPEGPVVSVGHDWGGAISLGWALARRERLAGVVLTNTAVHQPAGSPAPALIRLVRSAALRDAVCVRTAAFVHGALRLSSTDRATRAGYLAPYRNADRRAAIGEFVADIPLEPDHPSAGVLDAIADGLADLASTPTLLLWGPSDPVFSDRYLDDLRGRLPHADVHRFVGAGHLVSEDADVAGALADWLDRPAPAVERAAPAVERTAPAVERTGAGVLPSERRLWSAIEEQDPGAVAVTEMDGDEPRSVTFGELAADIRTIGAGFATIGVRPGDRMAVLVPPGIDLIAVVYGCWLAGASVVIADAGLGARGMSRALRSARPDHLVGIPKAVAAARTLRWPGRPIVVGEMAATTRRALGVANDLAGVRRSGVGEELPNIEIVASSEAAVLFTSGATGPAKGVVYRHHQLEAQRDAIATTYGIRAGDRLVAAFAPFALAAPALGITSVVPDMDVTRPGSLAATALAEAADAVGATLVFASPAALANTVATADQLDARQRDALAGVRILMSAGAPVAPELLRSATGLMPSAEPHTPYGMTEALPVADITLDDIEAAGAGTGVCVGQPLDTVEVAVLPLDDQGVPSPDRSTRPEVTGEVCVRAPHVKDRYDNLWLTEYRSRLPGGWHRTGDVGHLDSSGRLWIEGRLVHVIATAEGPITPVGVERRVEQLPDVDMAAAVGIGPTGTQQVVLVVSGPDANRRRILAPLELTDAVRDAAGIGVAAVLVLPELPVDIRHNSKIDRAVLARLAEAVLAGRRG